jgi:hypothetical protein
MASIWVVSSIETRCDRAALAGMLGPVHGDEHRQQIVAPERLAFAEDGDSAERVGRREDVGERLDLHDVGMAGHRPVRAEFAVRAEMDRILGAKPIEQRREPVFLPQLRSAEVDRLDRSGDIVPRRQRRHCGDPPSLVARIAGSRGGR